MFELIGLLLSAIGGGTVTFLLMKWYIDQHIASFKDMQDDVEHNVNTNLAREVNKYSLQVHLLQEAVEQAQAAIANRDGAIEDILREYNHLNTELINTRVRVDALEHPQ